MVLSFFNTFLTKMANFSQKWQIFLYTEFNPFQEIFTGHIDLFTTNAVGCTKKNVVNVFLKDVLLRPSQDYLPKYLPLTSTISML